MIRTVYICRRTRFDRFVWVPSPVCTSSTTFRSVESTGSAEGDEDRRGQKGLTTRDLHSSTSRDTVEFDLRTLSRLTEVSRLGPDWVPHPQQRL